MPALLPFRALLYPNTPANPFLYVPGEQTPPVIRVGQVEELLAQGTLQEDREPALFLYRQSFRFPDVRECGQEQWMRVGVMGVPGDRSKIYAHERVFDAGVEACRAELKSGTCVSSLFLWCEDSQGALARLLHCDEVPLFDYMDAFGCRHQFWRMTDPAWIVEVQVALAGQPLFVADGHHRFSANWPLATVQVRSAALKTFAAHRLVLKPNGMQIPETQALNDLPGYWERTPPGKVRFGVLLPELRGFELTRAPSEQNVGVLHRLVLRDAVVKPIRSIAEAADAVRTGCACMALLMEPLLVSAIEAGARRGNWLPAKSTDFFPKLVAGMVMYRHLR